MGAQVTPGALLSIIQRGIYYTEDQMTITDDYFYDSIERQIESLSLFEAVIPDVVINRQKELAERDVRYSTSKDEIRKDDSKSAEEVTNCLPTGKTSFAGSMLSSVVTNSNVIQYSIGETEQNRRPLLPWEEPDLETDFDQIFLNVCLIFQIIYLKIFINFVYI
jgi:hypothetical protein